MELWIFETLDHILHIWYESLPASLWESKWLIFFSTRSDCKGRGSLTWEFVDATPFPDAVKKNQTEKRRANPVCLLMNLVPCWRKNDSVTLWDREIIQWLFRSGAQVWDSYVGVFTTKDCVTWSQTYFKFFYLQAFVQVIYISSLSG